MLRWIARISCFFAFMLASSFLLAQSEFSAEIVDLQKPGTPTQAKIYFAKDKIRIESQNSGPHAGGAVIMNFATQTSMVVMAQQHMYMEMPAQAQTQRMGYASAFFRTGDVENACGDWQKMGHNGASCHKVGSETVNGRNTVKYETTNASGDVSHFWLDPKLRFPVKWQGKSNDGELRNKQEGAQPASLFEIPAGFTKMDMGGMMQMQPPH
jgi:hypothetical protein